MSPKPHLPSTGGLDGGASLSRTVDSTHISAARYTADNLPHPLACGPYVNNVTPQFSTAVGIKRSLLCVGDKDGYTPRLVTTCRTKKIIRGKTALGCAR